MPRRQVISNCGYYSENISQFLDYFLQPTGQKVKSCIKDTNQSIKRLEKLSQGAFLCIIDVVGLYPKVSFRRFLELRDNKQISNLKGHPYRTSGNSAKNKIFEFEEKAFKQSCGTRIRTTFVPPCANLFMADLEEKKLNLFEEKVMIF